MELKTISELRSLSPEQRTIYVGELDQMYPQEPYGHLDSLVEDIVATPEGFIPISMILFRRILEAFREYWWDDDLEIEEYSLRVTVEPLVRVEWNMNGRHVIFLTPEQYDTMASFRTIVMEDEVEDTDNFLEEECNYLGSITEEEVAYLVSLGLRADCHIPENSESLATKENTARFSGAMWYEAIQQKVITLAGVGGIGSYVGFLLARMKPTSIFIYDDDRVEAVNMSGQLYGTPDIGQYKVDALSGMLRTYADFNSVFAINQRFTEECEASDIMICGFDNMAARKLFFEKWRGFVMNKAPEDRIHCLFIDGRLAAEELQVYCITGDNEYGMSRYAESLFSDEEADETVCSYKQTTYMANMIGSIIVNLFTNFVANEMLGFMGRELPFLTSYSGLTMQFKIE